VIPTSRPLRRYLLVGLLIALSMIGVPAVMALFSKDRVREAVQVELVVGEEVARLPA
jgi:hypothetical protein